jgi:hypothetical protein
MYTWKTSILKTPFVSRIEKFEKENAFIQITAMFKFGILEYCIKLSNFIVISKDFWEDEERGEGNEKEYRNIKSNISSC